jgi:hypothetical protein
VPLAYQSTTDLMPAVETVTALQERSDFSAGQATALSGIGPNRCAISACLLMGTSTLPRQQSQMLWGERR